MRALKRAAPAIACAVLSACYGDVQVTVNAPADPGVCSIHWYLYPEPADVITSPALAQPAGVAQVYLPLTHEFRKYNGPCGDDVWTSDFSNVVRLDDGAINPFAGMED